MSWSNAEGIEELLQRVGVVLLHMVTNYVATNYIARRGLLKEGGYATNYIVWRVNVDRSEKVTLIVSQISYHELIFPSISSVSF